MIVLSVLLATLALVLLLPTLSDLISLAKMVGRRGGRAATADAAGSRAGAELPRLLFLVPAHDEELLIANTIASLRGVDYPADRMTVAVVADNCGDATAQVARQAGAEVLERSDTVRRGKPFAIEWALERLPVAEHDAVLVIDADSIVERDFAQAIAAAAPLRGKAVQSYNDVRNRGESALTRMAGVFGAARAVFMNELKQRAGLTVPFGNGLCIGSDVLARHGWTAFSICEDWELYAILTGLGVRVENVPGARVGAQEAKSLKQSSSQRQRWAAGKMTVLRQHFGPLLGSRRIGAHQKLDVIAELTGLGPAVHAGLVAVLIAAVQLLSLPGAQWLTVGLAASLVRPAVYTLLGLGVDPHPVRALLAFSYLPFYTVWRLAVQLLALTMLGNKPWVRTQRHADSTAGAA